MLTSHPNCYRKSNYHVSNDVSLTFCNTINDEGCTVILKGPGHAILDNFSTDQMVIELTKISQKRLKTMEELKQNTGKPRRDMDGQNWRGLKWIAFG